MSLPFKTDYAASSRSKCHTTKCPIAAGTLRLGTMVKSRNFDGMQPNWNDAEAFMTLKTRRKRPKTVDEIEGFYDLRPEDQDKMEGWIRDYTGKNGDESADAATQRRKNAVREQTSKVWRLRDLITGNGSPKVKALPPATIKAILTENKIPTKGTPNLVKTLAELFVFGVPPFGSSIDGCCESQPLRFCANTGRYVCKAAQAWGECTYSQAVEDTECNKTKLPPLKPADEQWLEAVQKICGDPQERLYVAKTTNVATITPATKKRAASTATPVKPAKRGKHKPKFSRACMDPDCGLPEWRFHVLDESNGSGDPKEAFPIDLYDTTLCITNLSSGTNSQYKLQVLVADGGTGGNEAGYLWRVWGRVGGKGGGGDKLEKFGTVDQAKKEFTKLFQKQTGNQWQNRKAFVKHPNKFHQLDVSYVNDDDDATTNGEKTPLTVKVGDHNSKLDIRVQEVVAAMFDNRIAMEQLKNLKIDLAKMPLGKMTEAQLKDAYSVLTEIETVLNDTNMLAAIKAGKIQQLSNQFYSKCPSTNPILIDSEKVLKSQVEVVDELLNLQASSAVINDGGKRPATATTSAVDEAYGRLKTEFIPLDPSGEQYDMLKRYVANTCNASLPGANSWGSMNDWESRGLRLLDAFEIKREGEASRFEPAKALGNRRLLWHGSRISNYTGILSQGLRIAPPEAPVSGYRFGKGVYFADMLGKSANYCFSNGSAEMFVMACDVSLGKTFETSHDMYMEKPQSGTHSTHAISAVVPNPVMGLEMKDQDGSISRASSPQDMGKATNKVLIPLGRPMKSTLQNTPSCDVSEFIVYDQAQVNIRFLLRLTTNPATKAADGSVGNGVGTTATAQSGATSLGHYGATKATQAQASFLSGSDKDDSDDNSNSNTPSNTKAKVSAPFFVKLDKEDHSRPSVSGLKVLNSRTFVEGLRLTVVKGDITECKTAAIVVPSDGDLSLGGMVGEKVQQEGGTAFVSEVNSYLSAPASTLLPNNITRLDTTTAGKTIRELAAAANVPYLTPFYKVVRKEDISATKDMICLEAKNGNYHRGLAARNFLGLTSNTKISLEPADIPVGVEVFVQSSSHNRKMPINSSVLLETSVAAIPAPAARKTLNTSDVCIVGGHGLPADHVVFVVSPIYNDMGKPSEAEAALKLAVKNALLKCSKFGLKTVALPSIGSGRAGYDKGKAAAWIIEAIAMYLEDAGISSSKKNQSIEEVCFCLFDDESLEAYREGILAYEKAQGS